MLQIRAIFNLAFFVLLSFLLSNFLFISVGGTGGTKKDKTESPSVTLADLIAEERRKEKENPLRKEGTLAELIREEEFDQFVDEMRENELLVEEIFAQKEKQQNDEQRIHLNMENGSESKNKAKELEEKSGNLKALKEKDPLLSQMAETLQLFIKAIKSGKKVDSLKEFLLFFIQFLAIRHQIPLEKIEPLKNLSNKKILANLIKFYFEEKNRNKKNGEKKEQKNSKSEKENQQNKFTNSSRMEQMLKLLRSAAENFNGTAIKQKMPKRRKKRDFLDDIGLIFMLLLILILFCVPILCSMAFSYGNQKVNILKISKALDKLSVKNAENEDAEDNCPICLESFELGKKIPILNCTHKFHKKCISQWIKLHNDCPMCRAKLFKISFFKAKPIGEEKQKKQQKMAND